MNEHIRDIEREAVEMVFGLGGGELHEHNENFPDEWDERFQYWYEGKPDYLSLTELGANLDTELRTAVCNCLFGWPKEPPGWVQVMGCSSSGETTCDCRYEHEDETPIRDCPLCEGDELIYIGDGWCEVVYKRAEEE